MRVLKRGHVYELKNRMVVDAKGNPEQSTQVIRYVNLEPGEQECGVTQQELLRMMIDRTRYCNECLPDPINARIEQSLREALALHEARALVRKVEKGELSPEHVTLGEDGHFQLEYISFTDADSKLRTDKTTTHELRKPECKHRSHEGDTS